MSTTLLRSERTTYSMYYDMETTNLSLYFKKISENEQAVMWARTNRNSDFSMQAAWTCFQTLKQLSTSVQIERETTYCVFPAFRALSTAD